MEKRGFAEGIVAGVVAGVVAGIMLAPKSGKETREELRSTYEKIKDDITQEISKMAEVTKEKYNKTVSGVLSGYQEAKEITPDQAKEIAGILEETFTRIEEATKKGKG